MGIGTVSGVQSGTFQRIFLAKACAGVMLVLAVPAAAQNGERGDSVRQDAVDAVTQPLSDLNLRSRQIPASLLRAQQVPYDLTNMAQCSAIHTEIVSLEEALGPDVDEPQEGDGLANQGLQLAGDLLGGLIPFRGLVRQVSGANAERARWESAIYSGVARRSFLKGYAQGKGCPSVEEAAVQSAEDVLGLEGNTIATPEQVSLPESRPETGSDTATDTAAVSVADADPDRAEQAEAETAID